MEERSFWQTLAAADDTTGEERAERIGDALSDLDPTDVRDFDRILHAKVDSLYTWDLWGVAYLLRGHCSDDTFEDFRLFVVSLGERAYQLALDAPEQLGLHLLAEGYEADELEAADLLDVAEDVYEDLTGEEIPDQDYPEAPRAPRGRAWDEGDLEDLLPRLAAVIH